MEPIDLEKYKSAWKSEQGFSSKKISEAEIHKFLSRSSKDITTLFRNGLVFDITLKILLGISCFGLIYLSPKAPMVIFSLICFIAIIAMIIYQVNTYKMIPKTDYSTANIKASLEEKVSYYYSKHLKSIYIGAVTGTLVFVFGFLYYLLISYGKIREFQIDDVIVIGIGITLSYVFNAFVQVKQHNFQIRQIEVCLRDIEENTINEAEIKKLKNKKLRVVTFVAVALLLGILLFLFLLFR